MNEEKINKFIEDEMDDGLGVQFIDGERFFGIDYKYDGGISVFDKTQQIIDDCDWWDVIPMNDTQIIQLLNELYEENVELKQRLSDLQKENYGNIDGIAFYQEENASLCEKISDLECENEELKQQLKTKVVVNKQYEELQRIKKENERLKSQYKVLHTQFQDLKKFLENNFNEYLTRDKLQRQILKLSDENEQLKKEILHKENKELKKEKKELRKYECKAKAFDEINELFENGLIWGEHNDE